MPWRTYWPALALAVPLGGGLGALPGILLVGMGLNWGSASVGIPVGAVIGTLNAFFSTVGALLAVRIAVRRGDPRLIAWASGGAAGGAVVFWVAVVAYFAVIGGVSAVNVVPAAVFSGLIAAAVAAPACAALMAGARSLERRRHRSSVAPGA